MEIITNKDGTISFREMIWLNSRSIKSPCFTRRSDARAWKVKQESERQKRKALGEDSRYSERILFSDYAKKWLEEIVKIDKSPKTYRSYESILRIHLYPCFQKKHLNEICEADGRKLLLKLKESGHAGKGINNIMMVLKAILNRAVRDMYLLRNPLMNLSKQKENLKTDSFWTKMEIQQFLSANQKDPLYYLYLVALHTGMRMGELCGLCFDRIDFQRNEIAVTRIRDKDGHRDTTKTGIKRVIPMLPIVKAVFLDLFKKNQGSSFVFLDKQMRPVDYGHIYRDFKKAQVRAGMSKPLPFHGTRHVFASQFMMNGGNIFDLQKILGHTDLKMTQRYAHFSPEHLQKAIGFMNMGVELESEILDSSPFPSHRENFEEKNNIAMLG